MAVDVEALYRRYGPLVLRRCRRLLRDEAQAVDALQDVFVLVVRNQQRLDAQAPSSLLYRLATNVCLNRLRGKSRAPVDADDEVVLRIAASLDVEARAQAASVLKRLFSEAPETSATIAVLHLLDGLTHEEVARQVGLSVSGVRKRLRRLTEALAAMEAPTP